MNQFLKKKQLEVDPNNFSAYLNLLTKHIIVGNGEGNITTS